MRMEGSLDARPLARSWSARFRIVEFDEPKSTGIEMTRQHRKRSWKNLILLFFCVVFGCSNQQQRVEPTTPFANQTSPAAPQATSEMPKTTHHQQAVFDPALVNQPPITGHTASGVWQSPPLIEPAATIAPPARKMTSFPVGAEPFSTSFDTLQEGHLSNTSTNTAVPSSSAGLSAYTIPWSPRAAATEPVYIHPTLPGTSIRDYSKPGVRVDGNTTFPTLPGTSIRDYSKPGVRVDR